MKRTGVMAAATAALAMLMVAGCMLLPGRFASDLTVSRNGTFSFAYKGEMLVMPLSKLASNGKDEAETVFEQSTCHHDKTLEERACTADEIAAQRKAWRDEKVRRKERKTDEDRMMKTMLGGLDPSDPKAAQEFAARLARQHGWKSVISKGDGRFEVEYAASGRLDHDFVFPVIEKLPVPTPFVTVIRRSDGTVRVDAPAFSNAAGGGPWTAMAMSRGSGGPGTGDGMPVLDGTFTLHTDGEVLANNTEEGPQPGPAGRRLTWRITGTTASPPTALIRLAP